ncbi:MAG: DUF1036 domain-containing protein [Robiginitomaculum sp.]|nr:DUF1036 domain-containing protein [Robiginitomaculum sp.]
MKILSKTILTFCLALSTGLPSFAQETAAQISEQTLPPPVQPPWQVCNETSFILNIATAGVPAGQAGQPVSVRGWQSLRPGKCQIIDVEKGTPRFVYARSATLHQGGIREWKGRYEYCIAAEDFTAKTDISCELQNMTSAKFLQIIPTESRTAFVEPEDYGRFAETAGLQRLLRDNNYDIKRIDGRTGRRTTNTLQKFLKDHGLKPSISVEAQYTALQENALKVSKNIGMQLCNRTTAKLWAALAYKNEGATESRGWWPIDKGTCIQPLTKNLDGRDAHYYLRMETPAGTDKILRVNTKDAKEFCIGPSKFSALHHEFCQDQGYVAARFKPVPAGKSGATIEFTDADFNDATVSGLR